MRHIRDRLSDIVTIDEIPEEFLGVVRPGGSGGVNGRSTGRWESRLASLYHMIPSMSFSPEYPEPDDQYFRDGEKEYTGVEYDLLIHEIIAAQRKWKEDNDHGHIGYAYDLEYDDTCVETRTMKRRREKLSHGAKWYYDHTTEPRLRKMFPKVDEYLNQRDEYEDGVNLLMAYMLQNSAYVYRGLGAEEYYRARARGFFEAGGRSFGRDDDDTITVPDYQMGTNKYMYFTSNPFFAHNFASRRNGVIIQVPLKSLPRVHAPRYEFTSNPVLGADEPITMQYVHNETVHVTGRLPFDAVSMIYSTETTQYDDLRELVPWKDEPLAGPGVWASRADVVKKKSPRRGARKAGSFQES